MQPLGRGDPFKKYGWVLIAATILVALFLTTSGMRGTGSDSVAIDQAFSGSASEQGLETLDAIATPDGAPGESLAMPGAYAKKSGDIMDPGLSSLYQPSPGAESSAPAPAAQGDTPAAADGKADASGNFAEAMAKVAAGSGGKDGWSGKAARSGFSRPKAKFGKVGLSRGGGGASSSASLQVVDKAFGTGGNTGAAFKGRQAPLKLERKDGKLAANLKNGRQLKSLRGAEKQALSALKGDGERAANMAARTFDAKGAGSKSLSDLAAEANSAALISGAGVPGNLKANDPKKIMSKEFEPPKIEDAKEVDDNKEYMQQKIMMMIISAAISGIVGPVAGGIGNAIVMGMGMTPPSSTSGDRVPDQG